jgi:hypothetical protein
MPEVRAALFFAWNVAAAALFFSLTSTSDVRPSAIEINSSAILLKLRSHRSASLLQSSQSSSVGSE